MMQSSKNALSGYKNSSETNEMHYEPLESLNFGMFEI